MNPQGTPENNPILDIPAVDPIQAETRSTVEAAQSTIATTGCGPDEYNDCTEHFESERQECRNECMSDLWDLRAEVSQSSEIDEALNIFWDSMIGYIESTNEKILAGWESELNTQIDWYKVALGGWWIMDLAQNPDAAIALWWAKLVLREEVMQNTIIQLEGIQSSSESIEVKLFRLSQLLYEVWVEAWAPAELERAHNTAMGTILSRVIESGSWAVAIEFINAQNWESDELSEMYTLEVIEQLTEMTRELDISIIKNNFLRAAILEHRNNESKEAALGVLSQIYWENDDVMNQLSAFIDMSTAWDSHEFEWSWVNEMISEYNNWLADKSQSLPLIEWQTLTLIQNTLTSLFSTENALSQYTESLAALEDIRTEWERIQRELERLTQAIIWASDEERIDELTRERNTLTIQRSQQEREEVMVRLKAEDAREQTEAIITETEEWTRDIAEFASYLDSRHNNIQEVSRRLISDNLDHESRESYEKALEVYFHQYTFEEIIENPTVRLSKLTNRDILLRFLIEYNANENLINTNFRDLPISLRNDNEIALNYPWKIDEDDFPYMQPSLLSDTDFIVAVIKKSINRSSEWVWIDISDIWILLQRFHASWWDTRMMVTELSKLFELYPDFKSQIKEHIPYSILNSDNEWVLWIEISDMKYSTSRDAINALNNLWNAGSPTEYENIYIPTFQAIDKFIERNPWNTEVKMLLIEKWWLSYTTFLKWNLGLDRSSIIWEHILQYDIMSIRFLEEWTRRTPLFQEKFIQSLPDNSLRQRENWTISLSYLLNYIPLESPEEIYTFTQLLSNRFPDALKRNPDWSFSPQVYMFIGSQERFRNVLSRYFEKWDLEWLDEETISFISACIFTSAGLIWETISAVNNFQEDNNIIGDLYSDSFREDILENRDFAIIFQEDNPEKLEEVMSILKNSSITEITEWDGIRLAEIFWDDFPSFIEFCKNYEHTEVSKQRELPLDISIEASNFSNWFTEFFTIWENGEMLPNIENIDNSLVPLIIAELRIQGITSHEYEDFTITLLTEKYNLTQDQASEWYDNIIKPSLHLKLLESIDSQEYAQALSRWEWNEYISQIKDEVGISAVRKIYPNATIDDNWDIIIPSENTIEGDNLDLQYQYREISSELMLTPEESQSLTSEELEMIASDETVRENFIGFRSTLVELWLTEMWKFRHQIFTAIWSLDFNLTDGDYVWENEMNIFLSKVTYATMWDVSWLRTPPSNLETTKQIIRVLNKQSGGINDVDSVNSVWEWFTLVENSFREKFAPKDAWFLAFNMAAFRRALK